LAAAEFDVVLALGPFYHLVDPGDRRLALGEVHRVLRPGGLLLATVMMRHAWMLSTLLSGAPNAAGLAELVANGVYRSQQPGPLTEAYLFRPGEVAPFFESGGFTTAALLASQGFLNQVQEQVAELRERDPAAWEELIELAYDQSRDGSIHGLSGHLLYAGRSDGGS
jgi:SAM-dependent methyltransferase